MEQVHSNAVMTRDLEAMASRQHDLLIIGGGITGVCIARDAALRGLKVALVEKKDFSHGTSAASSKLIHGGLRYLAKGDIGLVRESLRERRIWENIAPHMVDPLPMIMPNYSKGFKGKLMMSVALSLYDWIAWDRNRVNDPDKKIPAHRTLNVSKAMEFEPSLKEEGMTAANVYFDCQTFAPERIVFECLQEAVSHDAMVANYAEVTGFLREGDEIKGVTVTDILANGESSTFDIRATMTVNAAGPWAIDLLGLIEGHKPFAKLIGAKGIHLITRQLSSPHAIAMATRAGGHFFILPWRNHSIIGTTDTYFGGKNDEVGVSEKDIEDFLTVVNDEMPSLQLTRKDVLHFYAGIRPLVDSTPDDDTDNENTYDASRASEVMDHQEIDGLKGLLSALGGKWTTSRHVAETIVDKVVAINSFTTAQSTTEFKSLWGGDTGLFKPFVKAKQAQYRQLDEETVAYMCKSYGSRIDELMTYVESTPELADPLSSSTPEIGAQIKRAVVEEMAVCLEDAVFRRTGLGTLGHPGVSALAKAADIMGDELGWTETQKSQQIRRCEKLFETVSEATQ